MKEEVALSEKSTSNDLNYAATPNMERHHSAFLLADAAWRCEIAHEQCNSSDSELQKEIAGDAHREI
jgi:hypothetical protein